MAVAAYARIAEDLRGKITSRNIKPGGPLPSELELRDEYRASRNTVLDAIKKLKDEGLVETRPGQGWFARVRIVPFVNSIDWADGTAIEQARDRGRAPRATPPTVNLQPAPAEMADRLRVPVGTDMIVRRQEWFLDELPWKLQTAWCPRVWYDKGAHRLLTAEDIPEGIGAYLHDELDLPSGRHHVLLPAAQAKRQRDQLLRLPRRERRALRHRAHPHRVHGGRRRIAAAVRGRRDLRRRPEPVRELAAGPAERATAPSPSAMS